MKIISPLKLGTLTLPNNLIAGPLAGISAAPYRLMCSRYGNPAFCCTEMLSAHNMKQQNQKPRYTTVFEEEGLVCFQISGNDPRYFEGAIQESIKMGADLIDLNCGCPMKKIRQKTSGSKLLQDTERLTSLIRAMRSATDKPISIKIRVGGDAKDSCHVSVAKIAQEEGCDFITVHGRHWTEDYEAPVRYDQISEICNAVSIPVIGNGNIFDTASLKLMAETGCDGYMLSRGLIGNPWLSSQLIAEDKGEKFIPPTVKEVGHAFIDHMHLLQRIEPDILVAMQSRRLANKYARTAGVKGDFVARVMETNSVEEVELLISAYFKN